MPRVVPVDEWGVKWEEYKELSHFCLQYNDKKRDAAALLTIKLSTPTPETYHRNGREYGTFMPHGYGHISDPVAATAAKRERLLSEVRLIEQSAIAASHDTGVDPRYILKAVTQRGGMDSLYANPDTRPPIGERQFKRLRRKFFWILRELKNGDLGPVC